MSPISPDPDQRSRILVVRNDGLGDFILTLPLIAALKARLPGTEVHALVSDVVAELGPCLPDVDNMIIDPGILLKRHRRRFLYKDASVMRSELRGFLKELKFDAAILAYAERGSAAMIHRAGIPFRIGPMRRTFLWRFNRFTKASRKGSDRAEYLLALEGLEQMGLDTEYVAPTFSIAPPERPPPPGPYVVIHPHKRSGTALSWPLENFTRVIDAWLKAGVNVVAVGDKVDEPVLRTALGAHSTGSEHHGVRIETGLSMPGLMTLLAGARLFVGNSSGPLHLAGLVRIPHVGFYPQNRVSAPSRWRTLPWEDAPKDPESYLLAPKFPIKCVRCKETRCPHFNCVATIPMKRLVEAIKIWGLEDLAKPLEHLIS